jgi:hypothetical protein
MMEENMVDPLTLGVVGVAAGATLRLVDASAEWLTLRSRIAMLEAAADLPAGTEVAARRRDGSEWTVRVPTGPEVTR